MAPSRFACLLSTALMALLASPLPAAELVVPTAHPTIQSAVDAAVAGDVVLILPGTYTGPGNRDVNTLGKAITIRGSAGPAATTIECQGAPGDAHRGFAIASGGGPLLIEGLTIRGGWHTNGGGISISGAAGTTIRDCIIEACHAEDRGGGIFASGLGPTMLEGVVLRSNTSLNFGGGLHCDGLGPVHLAACIIESNSSLRGGGASYRSVALAAEIVDSVFSGNSADFGGGLRFENATASLCGSSIVGNATTGKGAGFTSFSAVVNLTDCDILDNHALPGGSAVPWGGGMLLEFGAFSEVLDSRIEENGSERGGGFFVSQSSTLLLRNSVVQANHALEAAGGWCSEPETLLDAKDTIFAGNVAESRVGGVQVQNATAMFEACTIADNLVPDTAHPGWVGGVECGFGGQLTMVDCVVSGNEARWYGGVLVWQAATGTFVGCQFVANRSILGSGGGLIVGSGFNRVLTSILVDSCAFLENDAAGDGGALLVTLEPVEATVVDSEFFGNTSGFQGGAVRIDYGGEADFEGCHFEANVAGSDGGAVCCFDSSIASLTDCVLRLNQSQCRGGALAALYWSDLVVARTTVEQNACLSCEGGGIALFDQCDLHLVDSVVRANLSAGRGGGIDARFTSTATLTNSLVVKNGAAAQGGGLAICCGTGATVRNCTIADNTATGGRGVVADGAVASLGNTIVRGTGVSTLQQLGGGLILATFSNIQGGWPGAGNQSGNPLFINAVGGDYRLQETSPSVDVGDNAQVPAGVVLDIDGLPRFADVPGAPNGGAGTPPIVDMGCHEVQPPPTCVPADLNCDGLVDGSDLGILLAAWNGGPGAADLDGSGTVGGADLGLLLASWTG